MNKWDDTFSGERTVMLKKAVTQKSLPTPIGMFLDLVFVSCLLTEKKHFCFKNVFLKCVQTTHCQCAADFRTLLNTMFNNTNEIEDLGGFLPIPADIRDCHFHKSSNWEKVSSLSFNHAIMMQWQKWPFSQMGIAFKTIWRNDKQNNQNSGNHKFCLDKRIYFWLLYMNGVKGYMNEIKCSHDWLVSNQCEHDGS